MVITFYDIRISFRHPFFSILYILVIDLVYIIVRPQMIYVPTEGKFGFGCARILNCYQI
jgi:hypothetical protein